MRYQQFFPPERLKKYVKYFWILESGEQEPQDKSFLIIPDGSPGLIFQEVCSFTDDLGILLPQLFIYGQTTKPTQQKVNSRFKTIGAYFYPYALPSLFGIDAQETTNQNIDVGSFQKIENVLNQLLGTPSDTEKIRLLSDYLVTVLEKNRSQQECQIRSIVSQITIQHGLINLSELPQHYSVSKRTLERRFLESIGVTAKFFARLIRFQSSLNLIRQGCFEKFSDIAYTYDYADQCHFIRDFKEFSGITPKHFLRQCKEMVSNYPELIA